MWILRRNILVYDPTLSYRSSLNPLISHKHYFFPLLFDDKNQALNFGVLTSDRYNKLDSVSTKITSNDANNQKIIYYRAGYNSVLPNIKIKPENFRADNFNASIRFCVDNPHKNIKVLSPLEDIPEQDKGNYLIANEPFLFPYGYKNTTVEEITDVVMLQHILANNYLNPTDMFDDLEKYNLVSKETADSFRENLHKQESLSNLLMDNNNE